MAKNQSGRQVFLSSQKRRCLDMGTLGDLHSHRIPTELGTLTPQCSPSPPRSSVERGRAAARICPQIYRPCVAGEAYCLLGLVTTGQLPLTSATICGWQSSIQCSIRRFSIRPVMTCSKRCLIDVALPSHHTLIYNACLRQLSHEPVYSKRQRIPASWPIEV